MSIESHDAQRARNALVGALHSRWRLFLIEGLVLLALGVAAIMVPAVATVGVAILIGWIVLVSGIVGLASTFRTRGTPGFIWSLLSAVLGIAAGSILLVWPLSGALSLTVVLTVFLTVEGIVSILYALEHRRELTQRWSFMLVSGVVDLVLAGMIFAGLPATAAWAIGLLVGVNMVMGGAALTAMALKARQTLS